MCVTIGGARISGTRALCYAVGGRHIVAYQNVASTTRPNVMLLNFPGSDIQMVRGGPEKTTRLLADVTADLPDALLPKAVMFGGRSRMPVRVEQYGDSYTVVLAEGPDDIIEALRSDEVPEDRRPTDLAALQAMVGFYRSWYPDDAFVLACFNGRVQPKYPITVSYVPHDPTVLAVPGLDGHDGRLPEPGDPVYRDFSVAFAMHSLQLPHAVGYSDQVDEAWAPSSVAGFRDNRPWGPNGDYVVAVQDLKRGLTGPALVDMLRME